jgi:hypothetical protein
MPWYYFGLRKAGYFKPANAQLDRQEEHLSESGRYKLVVTPFSTSKGSWNYTQGLVYRQGSDKPIAEVQRNYSSFPFLFIEDHPSGPFLVCGADYQGQTVIELDTGKRRDNLSDGGKQGVGFCWADYEFHQPTQTLVVEGCIWAAPYEFRFFDFSDPMSGWPEIEADVCIDLDGRKPEYQEDGTLRCFNTERDEPDTDDREVNAIITLRRDGHKFVKIDEWVSEAEQKRRADYEESQRKYEAEIAEFRASDPLYLAYKEHLKDPDLSPEKYEYTGVTYDGWCPTFTVQEPRIGRRVAETKRFKISIDWGRKTGPIKVLVDFDGEKLEDTFFEHSVNGMHAAFAHAKEILRG